LVDLAWFYSRVGKLPYLSTYKFSLLVENSKAEGYFTEKIIDCFAARTVPIYWGDPTIDTHFNSKGIIPFSNVKELKKLLIELKDPAAAEKLYNRMLPFIDENFTKAKQYKDPEVLLWEKGIKPWIIKQE
jgi:hypothetical protein